MKKFLILLIFNSIYTIANQQTTKDDCIDCKAIFSSDIKIKNKRNKTSFNISNEEIELILENTLKKIKIYKKEKNREIERINNQLERLTEEFEEYKIQKDREIKKLKSELAFYKRDSSKTPNRETYIEEKSVAQAISSTWIEIVVEDEVDIFQLALKYYGDRDKYKQIYLTNRDTIGDDLQIKNGMSLKIPITEQFEEKPMFINMD